MPITYIGILNFLTEAWDRQIWNKDGRKGSKDLEGVVGIRPDGRGKDGDQKQQWDPIEDLVDKSHSTKVICEKLRFPTSSSTSSLKMSSTHAGMISACVEWLADWVADLPPMVDEYDLEAWMESEGCEAVSFFLQTAFRKNKTRQEALEIVRALLWEWFLAQRDAAIANLPQNAEGVQAILTAPQTPQKTAAWYAESRDLLTGHEFAAVVLGTPAAFSAAVAKKCGSAVPVPEEGAEGAEIESRTVYTSPLNPFQWGWRYEPVIRYLYESEVAKAPVDDSMGRLRHRTLPRLAASPDGLIMSGEKAGRLLEIKAPKTRTLNGQVPAEYYCQMQLQAEVADVPAVEYVEVRFDAKDARYFQEGDEEECRKHRETFVLPTSSSVSSQVPQKMGCVLVIAPDAEAAAETWTYAYSPLFDLGAKGLEEALCWKPTDLPENAVVLERSIWRIEDWWTTTVPRNRRWWTEVGLPAYESFWEAVDLARTEGTYSSCLIVDEE